MNRVRRHGLGLRRESRDHDGLQGLRASFLRLLFLSDSCAALLVLATNQFPESPAILDCRTVVIFTTNDRYRPSHRRYPAANARAGRTRRGGQMRGEVKRSCRRRVLPMEAQQSLQFVLVTALFICTPSCALSCSLPVSCPRPSESINGAGGSSLGVARGDFLDFMEGAAVVASARLCQPRL